MTNNIQELLTQNENATLEFKREPPRGEQLAQTVIAYANGAGGNLIIGVEDRTKTLIGVNPDERADLEELVVNQIHDTIAPTVIPHITFHNIEGCLLLMITVYSGNAKPYYLKSKGEAMGTYVRVGASNRLADEAMRQELYRQRLNISFDSEPFYEATPEDVNVELVEAYLQQRQRVRGAPIVPVTTELLERLRILKREGERLLPTIGGLLLFCEHVEEYFPYAGVKCARFKGADMSEFIDQKHFIEPLIRLVEPVMQFAARHTCRNAKVQGIYREEKSEYPEVALREAVVNAICHRDYSLNSDIKFAIFDDGIEVTSPGALLLGMTLEMLGTGASEIRNRVIARIFREMGLIEEWGSGILNMRNAMQQWNLQPPRFSEGGRFFQLFLPNAPLLMG